MKIKKNKAVATLASATLLASTALSQAAVVWQDNFNGYANGSLAHQTVGGNPGGTGFPGQWFNAGGTVVVNSGVVSGNGPIFRDLGASFGSVSSTLWISFDWGHDTTHSSTYGGLTFFEGGTERALIGNTWDPATWNVTGAISPTGVSSVGMKTGVARISMFDGATDTIELWVGNAGVPLDVSGAAMATGTGLNLNGVNIIRIMGGNAQTFDNLTIGTTMASIGAVPEPSTTLLGGLGALALLRRRRK